MKLFKNTLPFIPLCLFMACASSKLRSDNVLFKKNWVLSELNGSPVQISNTDKDAQLKFSYSDMRVSGNGGCNSISGTFTTEGKDFTFGPLASTKMYCPDSKFEDSFLAALAKVNKYDIVNDELLFKQDKKVTAKLIQR